MGSMSGCVPNPASTQQAMVFCTHLRLISPERWSALMLTGEIRSQIDAIWNAFWTGGISNPLEVIEQITYLLFLKRLDDLHTLEENKAARLKQPMERRIFPKGKDAKGRPYEDLRWARFKHLAPAEMYTVVGEHV